MKNHSIKDNKKHNNKRNLRWDPMVKVVVTVFVGRRCSN